MMGKSHSVSAVATGLAVAPALGLSTLVSAAPFALMTGGAGTLPDLDHRSSSASKFFGPVGNVLSLGLRGMSDWIYQRTKGPRDEPDGKHRHLTHTILFALVAGGSSAGLCYLVPPLSLAVYTVCAMLTADRLGDRVLLPAVVGLVPFAALLYEQPAHVSWQTGLAITLGMVVHDLGDALTHSGCPLIAGLWPFQIAGETWFEVKLLGRFSFRTNGPVEHLVAFPLLIGTTAAAVVPLAPINSFLDHVHLDQLVPALTELAGPTTAASLLVATGAASARVVYLLVQHARGRRHVLTG